MLEDCRYCLRYDYPLYTGACGECSSYLNYISLYKFLCVEILLSMRNGKGDARSRERLLIFFR